MFFTAEVQNQEEKIDQFTETGNEPRVDEVIFSQSQIRKKDFLQFVYFRNEEIISCYQNAVQRIRGSSQKKLLLNMLERKINFKEKFLYELGGTGVSLTLMGKTNSITSSAVKYILDTDLQPVNTITDVYGFILKKERKEFELFDRLADLEENPEVKEIFLEQTRNCKEHISNLEMDFADLTSQAALSEVDLNAY